MAKKGKFYVVWFGNPAGIFESWKECKRSIDGVKGAQYKSFLTFAEAKTAYNKEFNDYKGKNTKKKILSPIELAKIGTPNLYSIAVDAASSGNPGIMEYRGVDTQTHKLTNNYFIKARFNKALITWVNFLHSCTG